METSDQEKRGPGRPKVEKKETITEFELRLDDAMRNGEQWIETTPENIQYFNRRGLGGQKYFTYKGLNVCAYGDLEGLLAKEGAPVEGVNFVTVLSTGTEPKIAAPSPESAESA